MALMWRMIWRRAEVEDGVADKLGARWGRGTFEKCESATYDSTLCSVYYTDGYGQEITNNVARELIFSVETVPVHCLFEFSACPIRSGNAAPLAASPGTPRFKVRCVLLKLKLQTKELKPYHKMSLIDDDDGWASRWSGAQICMLANRNEEGTSIIILIDLHIHMIVITACLTKTLHTPYMYVWLYDMYDRLNPPYLPFPFNCFLFCKYIPDRLLW